MKQILKYSSVKGTININIKGTNNHWLCFFSSHSVSTWGDAPSVSGLPVCLFSFFSSSLLFSCLLILNSWRNPRTTRHTIRVSSCKTSLWSINWLNSSSDRKDHRNGIHKPKWQPKQSMKGVSIRCSYCGTQFNIPSPTDRWIENFCETLNSRERTTRREPNWLLWKRSVRERSDVSFEFRLDSK